ncbi:hypothetical protein FQA39_LY03531 [Lamprigera yunnana]|nr:hypothetical protein FQA39_LY03531 [Lamprigera yunnana]
MSNMTKLKQQYGIIKSQLSRLNSYLDNLNVESISSITVNELEPRLIKYEPLWNSSSWNEMPLKQVIFLIFQIKDLVTSFHSRQSDNSHNISKSTSYSEADVNVTCSESETEGTTYRRKKKEKVISYVNADESNNDEDNTTIPMPPRISHSVMEEDSTSISSVESAQTLQHACKCTKNASEIRALRVEINA